MVVSTKYYVDNKFLNSRVNSLTCLCSWTNIFAFYVPIDCKIIKLFLRTRRPCGHARILAHSPTLEISIFFHGNNLYSHGCFYDTRAFVFSVTTVIPAGHSTDIMSSSFLPEITRNIVLKYIFTSNIVCVCNKHGFWTTFFRLTKTDSHCFQNCTLTEVIDTYPRRTVKTFMNRRECNVQNENAWAGCEKRTSCGRLWFRRRSRLPGILNAAAECRTAAPASNRSAYAPR